MGSKKAAKKSPAIPTAELVNALAGLATEPRKMTKEDRVKLDAYLSTRRPALFASVKAEHPDQPDAGNGLIPSPLMRKQFLEELNTVARDWMGQNGFTGMLILEVTQQEEQNMSKEAKAATPEQAPAATTRKFKTITTPHGEFREGSVTHSIYKLFTLPLKQALTLKQMEDALAAAHPDHDRDGMATTLRIKVSRFATELENDFKLGRDDLGRYNVHIEGKSTKRVLTPEALKIKADKLAAAEAAAKLKADEKAKVTAEKAAAKAAKELADAKAKAEEQAAKAKVLADAAAAAAKAAGVTTNVPGAVVAGKLATKPGKK